MTSALMRLLPLSTVGRNEGAIAQAASVRRHSELCHFLTRTRETIPVTVSVASLLAGVDSLASMWRSPVTVPSLAADCSGTHCSRCSDPLAATASAVSTILPSGRSLAKRRPDSHTTTSTCSKLVPDSGSLQAREKKGRAWERVSEGLREIGPGPGARDRARAWCARSGQDLVRAIGPGPGARDWARTWCARSGQDLGWGPALCVFISHRLSSQTPRYFLTTLLSSLSLSLSLSLARTRGCPRPRAGCRTRRSSLS